MANPRNSAEIRQNNIRSILNSIKENGPVSKRELQKYLGLSWGAVSALTSKLTANGYVVQVGKQTTNIGRKPDELDINSENNYLVGIDLNLSGICGVLADIKGRIIQKWVRLIAQNEYNCVIDTLFNLLDTIICVEYPHKNILGIGMAVQGIVDVANGVSVYFPEIRNWENVPIKEMIEKKYQKCTLIMHDPNCIMVAEKAFGSSWINIAQNAILLRIDNGLGMSMMLNQQLYMGTNGKAGELGHISMDVNGPLCACGNRGCLEEYASGNGLVRRFVEQVNQGKYTSANIGDINGVGYKVLIEAAEKGDELCLSLFRQMGRYLGIAVSIAINILNPDLVVLYGAMAENHDLYYDDMLQNINEHVFGDIPVKILISSLGVYAAAQGAALLASDYYVNNLNLGDNEMESIS